MKNRKLITAAALTCTAAMLAGTLMAGVNAARPEKIHGLANATFVWENGAETAEAGKTPAESVEIGLPMLENAVREYLGLDKGEALTSELLGKVTSIRFETSVYDGNLPDGLEGKTAVKCIINSGVLPGAPTAGTIDAYGYELVPMVVRAKYFDASAIADEWNQTKFRAFFTLKDPADPVLTERAAAEVNALFPNTVADALVICDPEIRARELRELAEIAVQFGIANTETLLDGTEIPLTDADTALFPNLEIVEFTDGLTPANPLEMLCMIEDCGLVAEEEVTESVTPESAAENEAEVVLESPLLNCAVREYFGLADGEILTAGMAAQVENITFCTSIWQEGLVMQEGYENKIAVKCIVNGGELPDGNGGKLPCISENLLDGVFNGQKSLLGSELLPVTVRSEYLRADDIADDWYRAKMNSFYVNKGMNPALTEGMDEEAVAEMLSMHPALAVSDISYIDPMLNSREIAELVKIGLETGIANEDTILDSTVIKLPWSDMEKLTGLIIVECLDDFTVEYTD